MVSLAEAQKKRDAATAEQSTSGSLLNQKICDAVLQSGATPFKVDTFLKIFAGCTIPVKCPSASYCLTAFMEATTQAALNVLKEDLKDQFLTMTHDCGSICGVPCCAVIVQSPTASYALPPIFSQTGFNAKTLKHKVIDALERAGIALTSIKVVRSDRGGSDGRLSRDLAKELGIPFISCPAHLLNNMFSCFKDEGVAYELTRLLNLILDGPLNERRRSRYFAIQQECHESPMVGALREKETEVKEWAASASSADADALLEAAKDELSELLKSIPTPTSLDDIKDLDSLCTLISDLIKRHETGTESARPAVFPVWGSTRSGCKIASFLHVSERIKNVYIFVAREIRGSGQKCESLTSLAELLLSTSVSELTTAFEVLLEATLPFLELFKLYSNAQTPNAAKSMDLWVNFNKTKDHLDVCGKNGNEAARRLAEAFAKYWGFGLTKSVETGFFFYLALRHFDPVQYRMMHVLKSKGRDMLMTYDDICLALPVKPTEADWKQSPMSRGPRSPLNGIGTQRRGVKKTRRPVKG
eukprot:TRINITY_DN19311_c0_g1_i1.p1 TRINITY_DN19311_c0_g1~~TRINITY_DN19311_c0_g1_i1.p1  ORF type:complete len:529 (-),score=31.59 TRINITY_DN19311_c0_g1_i1:470-2056(-)